MASESTYRGRQCDEFDREGRRCILPLGHGTTRDASAQHRTQLDDEDRVWTRRITSPKRSTTHYK